MDVSMTAPILEKPLMSAIPTIEKVEHEWEYIGKSITIARLLITAAAKNVSVVLCVGRSFPYKAERIATKLSLFTAGSIPFNLFDLTKTIDAFFKNLRLNDAEGVVFELVSFFKGVSNAYDNTALFVNSLLRVTSARIAPLLASTSLPVVLGLTSAQTLCHVANLNKTHHLHRSLELISAQPEINRQEIKEKLESFISSEEIELLKLLRDHTADPNVLNRLEQLQAKKRNEFLRYAPKETLEELDTLLNKYLSTPLSDQDAQELLQKIAMISVQLKHKIDEDRLLILANLFFIAAFILFIAGNVGSLPFLLLSAGLVTFIIHDYKE